MNSISKSKVLKSVKLVLVIIFVLAVIGCIIGIKWIRNFEKENAESMEAYRKSLYEGIYNPAMKLSKITHFADGEAFSTDIFTWENDLLTKIESFYGDFSSVEKFFYNTDNQIVKIENAAGVFEYEYDERHQIKTITQKKLEDGSLFSVSTVTERDVASKISKMEVYTPGYIPPKGGAPQEYSTIEYHWDICRGNIEAKCGFVGDEPEYNYRYTYGEGRNIYYNFPGHEPTSQNNELRFRILLDGGYIDTNYEYSYNEQGYPTEMRWKVGEIEYKNVYEYLK